jgi:molybdate transport system substrate-binding protein
VHTNKYLIFFCLFVVSIKVIQAQVTVAAAANIQFAMEELKSVFAESTGTAVQTVYGSSGKLCTQIKNGAPFDIFVSADTRFPDSLHAWGLTICSPEIYAYGSLVLWTTKPLKPNSDLSILRNNEINKVAIADPKSAPYGAEAVHALETSGLFEKIKGKIIYGDNVLQVSQYISSGAVDIGFCAKSIVMSNSLKTTGTWVEVDSTFYDPIAQAAVLLKHSSVSVQADRFFHFLYSRKAQEIFTRNGYKVELKNSGSNYN